MSIIKLFNNLRIGQKLFLISLSFSLPIAVLLWLVIKGIDYDIRFAQWEIYGDQYQRPLERLLKAIPEHDLLAKQYRAENGVPKDALAAKQREIDDAFQALSQAQAQLGRQLQFTAEGLAKRQRSHYRDTTVRSEWEALKGGLASLDPSRLDEKHAHLTADIRTMITHSGDISNLILDPDLDTYYMMDCTLLALPQTQDRLGQILTWGWDVLHGGKVGLDERIKLAVFANMLAEADMARVLGSGQTSLNEDLNFYGVSESLQDRWPAAMASYKEKTEPFIKLIEAGSKDPSSVTLSEFMRLGTAARDASFALWDVAVVEEDAMLRHRIEVFEGDKVRAVSLSAVALVVSLLLAFLITRSVTIPIQECLAALQSHAAMDFRRKAAVQREDEIGQIASGINKVVDAMRETIHEITKNSESLGHTAEEWAIASQELAEKSGDPAAREMVTSITQIAKNAIDLQQLASKFKVDAR